MPKFWDRFFRKAANWILKRALFPRNNWNLAIGVLENELEESRQENFFNPEDDTSREGTRVRSNVPVRFRFRNNGKELRPAKTLDVSLHGIRLELARHPKIAVGSQLELHIKIPNQGKAFRTQGTILWCKEPLNDPRAMECGVAFESRSKTDKYGSVICFIADKICPIAQKHKGDLSARVISNVNDLQTAARLLYKEHLPRGYCKPNKAQMHYTYYSLLPDSRMFILEKKQKVLGTVSLIPDSPCGLPIEFLYPKEIDSLRKQGRRLAEVHLLAMDREISSRKQFSLTHFQKLLHVFHLFKIMFDYARYAGVTDLIIGMHQKHQLLYRYLKFDTIGPLRYYPDKNGVPALLMRMNIERVVKETVRNSGPGVFFLSFETDKKVLSESIPWNADMLDPFLNEYRNLWETMPQLAREHLLKCYPELRTVFYKKAA